MHRYDPARRKLALGLAFLAGTVDATGFIRTGGYFASFMSGNTTRLGLHIAGQPSIAYIPFALICGFVTGVVLGSLLASRWPDWRKRALLAAVTLVPAKIWGQGEDLFGCVSNEEESSNVMF